MLLEAGIAVGLDAMAHVGVPGATLGELVIPGDRMISHGIGARIVGRLVDCDENRHVVAGIVYKVVPLVRHREAGGEVTG